MLVGNGTDAIFTALVLPLAPSAFSMALDSLSGASSGNARFRKRAFREAMDSSGMRKRREYNRQTAKSNDDYQSRVASDHSRMRKRREYSRQTQTGDYQSWVASDYSDAENREGTERTSSPEKRDRQSTKGKFGRRGRNKSTPSLVRMLIGLFPFLGFWSKLL